MISDGYRLFNKIKEAIHGCKTVTISYKDVNIVPAYWLNIAIGQLYGIFCEEQLRHYLKVVDADQCDLETLKRVVDNAKRYFAEQRKLKKKRTNTA